MSGTPISARERSRRYRENNLDVCRERSRASAARWRAANPDRSRSACRDYHVANSEIIGERKRLYYQDVRKVEDRTEAGRFRERDKKARRRSLIGEGHINQAEWHAILQRHDHRCAYCRAADLPLEMDHVIALSKGGRHVASNIVPACKPCNSAKGGR